MHYCEWIGALCFVAAIALGYFGNPIPAVKVGIAGISLLVFAKWFDYHYGIVIAGILISAAVGFLWAWYKDDPTEVKTLLTDIKTSAVNAEIHLSALRKLAGQPANL